MDKMDMKSNDARYLSVRSGGMAECKTVGLFRKFSWYDNVIWKERKMFSSRNGLSTWTRTIRALESACEIAG